MTPLPPLTPYNAVVDASLRTEIVSISDGSNEFISSKLWLIPSTITKGSLPVYDVIPLIITVGFEPGDPLENILTPGKPCKASSILTGLILSTSSAPTVDTAPEMLEAF